LAVEIKTPWSFTINFRTFHSMNNKKTRLTGWWTVLWALLFISPALPADIVPVREAAAAASQGKNIAANAVDGDLATRWSAEGNGKWLRMDLGRLRSIAAVEIAFAAGDRRNSFFVLEASADGTNRAVLFEGQSGGKTVGFERFEFAPVEARFVRYTGFGNSDNEWNSLLEMRVAAAETAIPAAGMSAPRLELASLFTDHAVLQRGETVPVWGRAAPDASVTVTFRGHEARAVADARGAWRALLPALEADAAGATGSELVVIAGADGRDGGGEIRLRDVVVGEVWLCSGQSNMAFRLNEMDDAVAVASADFPGIRHFKVGAATAPQPAERAKGRWERCTPGTAGAFTATGYYFAREIQARLGVPVGLINASVGGTQIESWMSARALMSQPEFAVVAQRWADEMAAYPRAVADYRAALAWWEGAGGRARLEAAKHGRRKPVPPRDATSRDAPSSLYNAMIAPLAPYALRGVLWDQGGANAARAGEYTALFKAHVTDWRMLWGRPAMPFYFVQNPNYRDPLSPGDNRAKLREAQASALALPATGMAVAIDIGEPDNVHPLNKPEVGRRLALVARATTYGESGLVCSGPVFREVACGREDGSQAGVLRVRFETFGAGLASRVQAGNIAGFEVAGADGVFHRADARIDGDEVVVSAAEVPAPAAVRYAWGDNPECGLAGGTGLPAVPFRARVK
jgi:sialate O-acetylesterase